jgi:C1A family cysteine protease
MYAPNFTKIHTDGITMGTGWKPRYMDRRDYTISDPKVTRITDKIKFAETPPVYVDKSEYFPKVKKQLDIGSCTANAGTYIAEYYQNKAFGKSIPGSRLFLYKVTRNLERETGDTGAYLRSTMAAIALFGIPPESYYPYITADYDKEPDQFVYSIADNYEATCYFCHDPIQDKLAGDVVINQLKRYISAGIPSMFGFFIFPSFISGKNVHGMSNVGYIPFPGDNEDIEGGHAVTIAGYDDNFIITNGFTGESTMGAFKIINSWGTAWGLDGYGWLPYKYVEAGLACDFWSLISMKWLDTGKFGL